MIYEEFVNFYKKYQKCPNDNGLRKNSLNENQLKSRYEKYLQSEEKKKAARDRYIEKARNKEYSKDEKWEEVKKIVYERDNNECQLYKILSIDERIKINADLFGELKNLDPCHIFRKSTYPELKYDVDNIVILYRLFHSRLDEFRDPLNGKYIGPEGARVWWSTIIGTDKFISLRNKIN